MAEIITAQRKSSYTRFKFLLLVLLPVFAFLFSVTLGRYSITFQQVFEILIAKALGRETEYSHIMDTIIFQVRIPRIITAMLVGSALSVSGAVYQGMFKNPMASPEILGTSAGAGFGAALAILFSFSAFGIQAMAFAFGMIAVLLTYTISMKIAKGGNIIYVFILAGILVGTVFQSFISFSKYVADPYDKLPAITFWLMGSLSSTSQHDVIMLITPFLLGIIPIVAMRWHLNTLSFGEEEARALGINTGRIRVLVLVCTTLLIASAVSVSGMVGWVGLIIPHLARMLVGPNFKQLIPESMLMGATYLLLVDNVARSMTTLEIPLGILTSLIGAPFFIFLLINTKKGWS